MESWSSSKFSCYFRRYECYSFPYFVLYSTSLSVIFFSLHILQSNLQFYMRSRTLLRVPEILSSTENLWSLRVSDGDHLRVIVDEWVVLSEFHVGRCRILYRHGSVKYLSKKIIDGNTDPYGEKKDRNKEFRYVRRKKIHVKELSDFGLGNKPCSGATRIKMKPFFCPWRSRTFFHIDISGNPFYYRKDQTCGV